MSWLLHVDELLNVGDYLLTLAEFEEVRCWLTEVRSAIDELQLDGRTLEREEDIQETGSHLWEAIQRTFKDGGRGLPIDLYRFYRPLTTQEKLDLGVANDLWEKHQGECWQQNRIWIAQDEPSVAAHTIRRLPNACTVCGQRLDILHGQPIRHSVVRANVLDELLSYFYSNQGITFEEILWVGNADGSLSLSWSQFEKVANVQGVDGLGWNIARDLVIVAKKWWLERRDFDGEVDWELCRIPYRSAWLQPFQTILGKNCPTLEELNPKGDDD